MTDHDLAVSALDCLDTLVEMDIDGIEEHLEAITQAVHRLLCVGTGDNSRIPGALTKRELDFLGLKPAGFTELAERLFIQRGTTIDEWYVEQLINEAGALDLEDAREEVFHQWVGSIKPGDAWEYLYRQAKDEDSLRWLLVSVQYDEDPEELMS